MRDNFYEDFNYGLTQCCNKEEAKCRCAEFSESWLKDQYGLAKRKGKVSNYTALYMTLECELVWVYEQYAGYFPRLFRVWENGKLLSNSGYTHKNFEVLGEFFGMKNWLKNEDNDFYVDRYTDKPDDMPEHCIFKIDWTLPYVPGYPLSLGESVRDYNKPCPMKLVEEIEQNKSLWGFYSKNQGTKLPYSLLEAPLHELRAKGVVYYPHLSYEAYPNPITIPFKEKREAEFTEKWRIINEKGRQESIKEYERQKRIWEEHERYRD